MTDTAAAISAPTPETTVASRIGAWLDTYSEIAMILPVVAGLLTTNQLRLRGAQALLVNLLIAAIVRQGVGQLREQAQATPPPTPPHPATDAAGEDGAIASNDYVIVHAVPGRIRLRIPRLRGDRLYAKQVQTLLTADARVKQVRINRAAASLVIQYDDAGLTELELGMYLLQILEQAETPPTAAPPEPPAADSYP
ncbi:HMA2 domain-containing protein [Spirulina major]|uniref:HMA2 domain-containing protein n=1 Tax=Spirulina major TaxID=270636 RepID=UPI00093448B2|nr:hypothetical protein [Spirulina major]